MTGRENIYMNGAILGMSHDEIDKKVDAIIDFSEIGEHIDTPVKRYSSGMYVRLAFAVAAHLDSDILIADEVLAVGDAEFQKKALEKMNKLSSDEGRTVLFVSHNMVQIKKLCNKGVILEKGHLVRQSDDINRCIDYYLNGGVELHKTKDGIRTVSWYNDGGLKNEFLTQHSVEVLNEKGDLITKPLSTRDTYFIQSKFSINVKSVKPICYEFLLMTGFTQIGKFSIPLMSYEKGDYEVSFKIRPGQIPPGDYRLVLSASVWYTSWIVNPDCNDVVVLFSVNGEKKYNKQFSGIIKKM